MSVTSQLLTTLVTTVDSIEGRVNDMADDVREMKRTTADMRDRVARLEGELNSTRRTQVNVHNQQNTGDATGVQGTDNEVNKS